MIRPLIGESFAQCKDFQWSLIHTSQDLISAIQKTSIRNDPLTKEVVQREQQLIKEYYAELKELQSWWNKEGKHVKKQQILAQTPST